MQQEFFKGADKKEYNLSQSQIDSYNKDGYIVIEGLFSQEECDFMLNRMLHCADENFAAIMNPDRIDYLLAQTYSRLRSSFEKYLHGNMLIGDLSDNLNKYVEIANLMRNILKDQRVGEILKTLQGKEVVALMSQMLFKEANSPYASQAWNPHQDNSYPQNENKAYITTNLFLSDADLDNGCLYMFPGSHRELILPVEPTPSYREVVGTNPGNTVPLEVLKKYQQVNLIVKKGDLLVMNGNTIHGSYPNKSKTRSRPLFSCSYISKGEFFIPGKNARRMEISLN